MSCLLVRRRKQISCEYIDENWVPWTDMQIEYVHMHNVQRQAYKEAIEEYRAAARAPVSRLSDLKSNGVTVNLPRRQISNYFVQFRKVCPRFW